MRLSRIIMFSGALILAACSPSEKSQTGDRLRSDIPLHTIVYLSEHPQEAAEIEAMCEQWKASQRPLASWPAIVTGNCNNANAARLRNLQREQRERMKKQVGI